MTDNGSTGRGRPSDHDTGTAGQNALADQLGALARSLERQPDLRTTLDTVVRAAVDTVPGAQAAAISEIRRRREVTTLAATGELARAVDHAQHDLGEGPCLDTLYAHLTVRLADLSDPADEQRWPRFAARARELGVGSVLAVQLFVDGTDLGALSLLSRQADAFGDESEHVALLFATHASIAVAGERAVGNLRAAVSTREVIGQAQGILMERFKVTGEMAFHMLMVASQHSNRKLRDVAGELVATGEFTQA